MIDNQTGFTVYQSSESSIPHDKISLLCLSLQSAIKSVINTKYYFSYKVYIRHRIAQSKTTILYKTPFPAPWSCVTVATYLKRHSGRHDFHLY